MKKIFFTLLTAVLVLVLASPAGACRWLSPSGDPYGGTSWSQDFSYYAVGKFDALELFITSGGPLVNDGMRDFIAGWTSLPLPSWSSSLINRNYAFASGDPLRYIEFSVDFAGDMSDPLSFDLLAWGEVLAPDGLVEGYRAIWDGSEFDITRLDLGEIDVNDFNRVPEPSTMLLLGSGLIGIGVLRRRFRK